MRKKSESTIIERALDSVPGFDRVFQKLQQQVILRGQSKSTLHNYIRRVAAISLHFGRLPELMLIIVYLYNSKIKCPLFTIKKSFSLEEELFSALAVSLAATLAAILLQAFAL